MEIRFLITEHFFNIFEEDISVLKNNILAYEKILRINARNMENVNDGNSFYVPLRRKICQNTNSDRVFSCVSVDDACISDKIPKEPTSAMNI